MQSNTSVNHVFASKDDCRLCGGVDLNLVLDLGLTFLADEFLNEDVSEIDEYRFPLKLNSCGTCGWLQTSVVVNPVRLYQNQYPYDSSITKTGKVHWEELANSAANFEIGRKNSRSLDIGANVGVLVNEFKKLGFKASGVDPSYEATQQASQRGIDVRNYFFNLNYALNLRSQGEFFDVITATNVFAHIDDLNDWALGITKILSETGILIIEAPHALNLIKFGQFDTIYHEHLSYVLLTPLVNFFDGYGLEIVKVQERPIHGGTIRLYISRIGNYEIHGSVKEIIRAEKNELLDTGLALKLFSRKVSRIVEDFQVLIKEIKEKGQTLVAISAPAKGMTFLNFTGLHEPELAGISDATVQKQGRFAPGTGVVVKTDHELAALNPDYAIILAWNFAPEILQKIRPLYGPATKFLVAIPELKEIL